MPTYRVDAIHPAVSGITRDVVINSWHFQGLRSVLLDGPAIVTDLDTFYTRDYTGFGAIARQWAPSRSRAGHVYRIRDVAVRGPGVLFPSEVALWPLLGGTTPVPEEVALCMSYGSLFRLTRPRERGRLYLGPWNTNALLQDANGRARPDPARITRAITMAASALATAATSDWSIYSPTTRVAISTSGGWVDDAWDTQRRRGPRAAARTNW